MNSQDKLIFIVDDDVIFKDALQKYLSRSRHGFKVLAFGDGIEVLVQCLQKCPDLIISDIRMPKLDGISLMEGIKNRKETAKIPIIFMSAYIVDEILDRAKQLGARHFLFKPFPLDYLDELIDKIFSLNDDAEASTKTE